MNRIKRITEFCPSISTSNTGDFIIEKYCSEVIDELFPLKMEYHVPTREKLSRSTEKIISTSDYSFVYGTNLLTSDMKNYRAWNLGLWDAVKLRLGSCSKSDLLTPSRIKEKLRETHIILLGTGWYQYEGEPTVYTKRVLQTVLDPEIIHSVRDEYTAKMMKKAGFSNVINTACPTMWKLTEEKCEKIPASKSKNVVTTLTNYSVDPENDGKILRILKQAYDQVYVWLQAIEDYPYLLSLPEFDDSIHIVMPGLKNYTDLLESGTVEYVGTRLHAGIQALNYNCRTLILAVDNRAIEISKDTHIPVISRDSGEGCITDMIYSERPMEIILPKANIDMWKSQFL